MPEPQVPPELLGQKWVHAHEEDTPTEMVFRPAGHPLPPARGRRSFELRARGVLVEGGPGPTDRGQVSAGTWRLAADGTLAFYRGSETAPYRTLRIVSVTKDRLVARKMP